MYYLLWKSQHMWTEPKKKKKTGENHVTKTQTPQ